MIGVVVIGRNEGAKLERCLLSVRNLGCLVVYADSSSSDGSADKADSLGVEVVRLISSQPMNAARGRKEGFEHLLANRPKLEYVLFLDGDCELDQDFVPTALKILVQNPRVAVVCGRRRELHPEASIYNRIANLEWDTPIGETKSCGGDALIKVSAYLSAGGFNETVLAGEEPELCSRIRRLGYKVLRIDVAMSRHDMNMHQLSQWWRRGFRTGYGALDVRRRHGVQEFNRLLLSAWLWVLAWPLVGMAMVYGMAVSSSVADAGLLALLVVSLLPLQVLRVARAGRKRGLTIQDALAYGALMMVNKWACASGQLKWLLEKH